VRERRERARLIQDQQQRVKDCRRRIRAFEHAGMRADAAQERATLKKERKILDGYLDEEEPFLLLASQLTRRKLPYPAESGSAPSGDVSRARPSLPSRG
jgi:hypothetical protein